VTRILCSTIVVAHHRLVILVVYVNNHAYYCLVAIKLVPCNRLPPPPVIFVTNGSVTDLLVSHHRIINNLNFIEDNVAHLVNNKLEILTLHRGSELSPRVCWQQDCQMELSPYPSPTQTNEQDVVPKRERLGQGW
jgi:hypothetical protein